MGRAPCCDKANVKKGPWSPDEDAKLKAYIQENGTGGNWIALPQKIGLKRCGKSCRLRWLNYLRPNIKHGGFSEEEDNIICTLFLNIGSRWSIIAAQLPGRTDNDIKNYWNTKLKKKLMGKQRKAGQRAIREVVINEDIAKIETNFVVTENTINPSLYYPELPVHVPSLYPGLNDHINDQYSIMRGKFYHDHQQPNINTISDAANFEYPFEYFSPYEDLVYENSINSFSSTNSMKGDFPHFPNMYQGFNSQTNDQLGSYLGATTVNCTSGTSSVESSSRGDINSMVYDPSMGVHDFVFQEPKCLGVK